MLSNVTIIIPAHNRPERLQRLLNYYSRTNARILIPDSSDLPFAGTFDPSTTTYIHRPRLHFLLKLREVLPLITTPYVLYCADDDFTVPEGIAEVTRFLDANPDYVVAQGHYLTFEPRKNGKVRFSPRYIRNFTSRVSESTPHERLLNRQGQYASFLYGVVRLEVFKSMYQYCFEANGELRFRNLFLAEEFFCHATRIYGKYATIPTFYSARENIPGSATVATTPSAVIRTSPEHRAEYDGYIRALTLLLAAREPALSEAEAEQMVRRADAAPIDTPNVTLKRRIIYATLRHKWLRPLSALLSRRYAQKGLRAVKGMDSYPCREQTPQIMAILNAINS